MKILSGEIEGRIYGNLNGEWTIKVGDDKDDLIYLSDWIKEHAPEDTYVIITVAVLEGV